MDQDLTDGTEIGDGISIFPAGIAGESHGLPQEGELVFVRFLSSDLPIGSAFGMEVEVAERAIVSEAAYARCMAGITGDIPSSIKMRCCH